MIFQIDGPTENKDTNFDEDDEDDIVLDAVKQQQSRQEDQMCMMPQNMDAEIVVNTWSVAVKVTADGSKDSIKIAPGEGKIPTNMMREKFMDVKAFPRHHPTGQFGLYHPREFELTPSQYFNQRCNNEDERFSKDSFYLFMAASFVEQHSLEGNIDISGVKGQQESLGGGTTRVT